MLKFKAPEHTSSVDVAGAPVGVVDGLISVPADTSPEQLGALAAAGFEAVDADSKPLAKPWVPPADPVDPPAPPKPKV